MLKGGGFLKSSQVHKFTSLRTNIYNRKIHRLKATVHGPWSSVYGGVSNKNGNAICHKPYAM